MTIRTLIYGLVGAVAFPLIAVAVFLILSEYSGDRAQAIRSVEYFADRVGDDMNHRVSEAESVLAAVAARPSVRTLDGLSCEAGLEIFRAIDPARANLAIGHAGEIWRERRPEHLEDLADGVERNAADEQKFF